MGVTEKIQRAIERNETIEIIYYGGSHPGQSRIISPLKIENDKVSARADETFIVKAFFLSKIAILENGNIINSDSSDLTLVEPERYETLSVFFQKKKPYLEALGWDVSKTDENRIELSDYFKNGKVRKSPFASVYFEEFIEEYVYDISVEDIVVQKKKKLKPWTVYCKKETTRTFSIFENSVKSFLEFAEKYAPQKRK